MIIDTSKFKHNWTELGINPIAVFSKFPTAMFVGQFPLKTRDGFTDWAVDVFYEPNPRKDLGHGHYFALYVDDGKVMITGADHVETLEFTVIETEQYGFVFSRFQHDFRTFGDISIDGGWWLDSKDGFHSMRGRVLWGASFPKCFGVIIRDGRYISRT
jgi:hypothetical protein